MAVELTCAGSAGKHLLLCDNPNEVQPGLGSQASRRLIPGHVNVDTSLSKRFTIVGGTNVEFRWDAFNLFNHPGSGFPNANIGSPTAGRITSTVVDVRSMQFALKFNFQAHSITSPIGRRACRAALVADIFGGVHEACSTEAAR